MPFQQHKVTGVWREIDAQGRPVGERGTIYTPPADPYKGRQEARQDNEFEYRRANDAADRKAREDALNAEMQAKGFVRGPNGWVKADPKDTIAPEDRSALAQDARTKLETIASLRKRSRDGYFATGFGQPIASMIPGTTARDVQSDVATIGASGALQKVMEMSAANGGKNPLTPLSNADMIMLGQSVSNLDPSQSDDQFIKNLSAYEDIYRRQLQAVEPNAEELRPQAGLLPDGARKVATGKDRWVPDDAYNSTIFKMWRSGASRAEMNALLDLASKGIHDLIAAQKAALAREG